MNSLPVALLNPLIFEGDELLEGWKYLPGRNQLQDTKQCAALYRAYIAWLVERSVDSNAQLSWSSARCSDGMWIAGVRRLDWDTNIFGVPIGRLEPLISPAADVLSPETIAQGKVLIQQSKEQAKDFGLKLISVAVDSRDSASQLCLQESGFRMMDTIVVYRANLAMIATENLEAYGVRKAVETDIEPLAAIAAECFGDRQYNINRFNCEPSFRADKVRQMYAEWLRSLFKPAMAEPVLVADRQGEVAGFIGLKLPTPAELQAGLNLGRVPLNAVHPRYHKRGIYTRLVMASLAWFKQQSTESVQIGTQLSGQAVQRVWQKLGASLDASYHTFHFTFQ